MHKSSVVPLLGTLLSLVFVLSLSAPVRAQDPFFTHNMLMGRAIMAGDLERVTALLKTPYITLNSVLPTEQRPLSCGVSFCQTHLDTTLRYGTEEILHALLKAGARLISCGGSDPGSTTMQCIAKHLFDRGLFVHRSKRRGTFMGPFNILMFEGIITRDAVRARNAQGKDFVQWLCGPIMPGARYSRIEQHRNGNVTFNSLQPALQGYGYTENELAPCHFELDTP